MPSVKMREQWVPEPMMTYSQGGYIVSDYANPQVMINQLQHDNARLSSQVWKLQTDVEQLTQILAGVMEYVGLNPKKQETP